MVFQGLLKWWASYRHRFLPWIIIKMKKGDIKTADHFMKENLTLPPKNAYNIFVEFFEKLYSEHCKLQGFNILGGPGGDTSVAHRLSMDVMKDHFGFCVERAKSNIPEAGFGVKVTKGQILENTAVALYPGTIYYQFEPLFFQSVSNQFIFRCSDGLHIDGKDKGLSKMIYKSCGQRDRCGPYLTCDFSWLTNKRLNPLAVGQYINNHNHEFAANVAYTEFDFPLDGRVELLRYIPNICYSSNINNLKPQRTIRLVLLVSTRDIEPGEELFSTYFTTVK